MTVELSVVICTHNRYHTLRDAIASLEIQDCAADRFELLVVDNSSDTQAQRRFMNGLDITCLHDYIVEGTAGLSRARNIGVRAARGHLVAFMDDDARACGQWVSRILEVFNDEPSAGIVGGPVRPVWPGERPSWLHPWLEGYLTILDYGTQPRSLDTHQWLAGTNIAFRHELLLDAGGFNENLGRIGKLLLSNEELHITSQIRERGYSVRYDPRIEMFHKVHEDRINQPWMRRRVFWQVVSDLFAEGGSREVDLTDGVSQVLDYLAELPPKDRGLGGLFLDTTNPQLFHRQTEALAMVVRLLAASGQDWRAFLDVPAT